MDMNIVHVMCISLWGIVKGDGSDGSYSYTKFKGKGWQKDEYAQGPDNLCGAFHWISSKLECNGLTLTVWYGSKIPIKGWNYPEHYYIEFINQCDHVYCRHLYMNNQDKEYRIDDNEVIGFCPF